MSKFGVRLKPAEEHVADGPVRAAAPLVASASSTSAGPSPAHSRKFRLAIALLVVAGIASLGAAIILSTTGASHNNSDSGASWSDWQPSQDGLAGAQEIADVVAPGYRASPAYQLSIVTVMNLNDPTNPLQVVIPTQGQGATSSGVAVLPTKSTVAYNLCGLGSHDCSIGVGKPSAARLLLLRREALELALYTFKYISSAQQVVAVLPPGHTAAASCTGICPKPHVASATKPLDIAVVFTRRGLQPLLDRPLRSTLPQALPPTVDRTETSPGIEYVSYFTANGLFQEHNEQAQDGSKLIVLNPLPAQ